MTILTTGKLAKRAGVNVETIRYYERRGLLPEPLRRESGYRQYSKDALDRLQFIKYAKDLGFSLREILDLLTLVETSKVDCKTAEKITGKKVSEIEKKIKSLQTMKRALLKFKNQCANYNPDGLCIINDIYTCFDPNKKYTS